MNGNTAFGILNRTVQGLASGVKSHSVEDLTLHLVFNDGTTSDIVFEQPADGEKGDSAYEIAVKEGFEGTEEEWLKSLQGENGVVVTCKFPYWETSNESSGNTAYIASGEGYLFTQDEAEKIWTITHNLGNQYPCVVCIDNDNNQITGNVNFQSENVTVVSFSEPTKGKAFIR